MKKIYIAVITILVMSIALFILSFAYLDSSKRRTYDFVVSFEGRDIGTIRVDKFITEEKLIYKSVAETPFAPAYTAIRSRLDLGKSFTIESYEKEMSAGRASDILYLQNVNGLVSFVEKSGSSFSFVDNIPTKKETFIFEEDSPMTYMPIIANYDFSKGRSQVFNTLTCQTSPGLPPMKRILTLTSIKDEYLKVDARKIKTENLILKMRDYPQLAVWVAKSDRAIIKIELPNERISITRSFRPRMIRAAEYAPQDPRYLSKEVVFKSRGVELSGTLTTPTRSDRFPAVLLVSGPSPADRNLEGFFASVADHLSKNGICVLRFDRRGIGASKGDASTATDAEEAQDALAALESVKGLNTVNPEKIAVVGHGKGAQYALKLLSDTNGAKAAILIAPEPCRYRASDEVRVISKQQHWSDDYAALVARTTQATEDKIRRSKGDWAGILGIRCYVNGMRGELCGAPADIIGKVKVPVLIMQGKQYEGTPEDTASEIAKAFTDTGNKDCTVTFFNWTGQFPGSLVNNGTQRLHYEADEKALESMQIWLELAFSEPDQNRIDSKN